MSGGRALALIVASCMAACSLLSLDGYSNGVREGDAGSASGDASASDSAPPDARTDATLPDGAPAHGCAVLGGPGIFCDDFDSQATFLSDWTNGMGNAPKLVLDTQNATSAPRSALFASGVGTSIKGGLGRSRPAVANVRVAFDLEIDQLSNYLEVMTLFWGNGAQQYSITLTMLDAKTLLTESGAQQTEVGVPALAPAVFTGKWHRVEMRLVGNKMDVGLDGSPIGTYDVQPPVWVSDVAATFIVTMGIFANAPSAEWRVRFDDVVIEPK